MRSLRGWGDRERPGVRRVHSFIRLRRQMRLLASIRVAAFSSAALAALATPVAYTEQASSSAGAAHPCFELLTERMDVDVDGAPNAYGPLGSHTLDVLKNAHYMGRRRAEIVGYLTRDDDPTAPVIQGPHDPYPGLYISQTAFTDPARTDPRDVLRYVDATRISYVVLGNKARRKGVQLGDFVAVYSRRTHRSEYGIVGDDGNPSGDEGSLHLLQALGYPFHDGREDAVEERDIVVRYFPRSNPEHRFFLTQAALDKVAEQEHLSRDFSASRQAASGHPKS